ncbi:UNKNOWN [Stylonychia lemnae]|uniref:Arf3-interacting protein 1 N-terminal domain-containing protein n=1 Tax=Stylonychia lemnae TaxID=5949 RepID=A0A078AG30_STYLE|nr:UNKNOWN [Stylonychia lemnae]|eukprot:CDW80407.1 UNKNOWN [Stylonychia lemnae]
MLDYIVLAEFDINQGSVIRYQHPAPIPNVEPGIIASYMLPEGGHNRSSDSTYFIVNRKKSKDLLTDIQKIISDQSGFLSQRYLTPQRMEQIKAFSLKKPAIDVKLFQILDLKWISFYSDLDNRQLTFKVVVRNDREFTLVVCDTNQDKNISLEIKSHPFLNFTHYQGTKKFSFQNEKGNIFGVELSAGSDFNIQDLAQIIYFSPYNQVDIELTQTQNTFFFNSQMKNKLDTKAKRGAIVKALAIGSKNKCVLESFKKVINQVLECIFEVEDLQKTPEQNLNNIKTIITQLYEASNSQDVYKAIPQADYIKRRVYHQIGKNLADINDPGLYKTVDKVFYGNKSKVCIPQVLNSDEIASTSIKKFVLKFGERTMLIYDSLLSEKRILFSGALEFSADEIQEFAIACASLISPILGPGIIQKLHPYAALSNLDFLEETGYIAGVTNPMFKQRGNWHDVCCEIDIGKLKVSRTKDFYVYEQEKYYNLDMDFIRPLIARIKSHSINDEELKRAFESYTLLMLDLAFKDDPLSISLSSSGGNNLNNNSIVNRSEELTHENEKLQDLLYQRIRRFQKTNLYKIQRFLIKFKEQDYKSNINLALIETLLRKLRISREISSEKEVLSIFVHINRYLQDEDAVTKLLYLLPNSREGIVAIAQGLFSPNEEVERLTTEILKKIESTEAGKCFISNLNYFFMLKYQYNLYHKDIAINK